MASSTSTCPPPLLALAFIISSLVFFSTLPQAESCPPSANGLSWSFYETSCPMLEQIVRDYLKKAIRKHAGLAPGLLRMHFHDCFVQGCDASVLLDGPEKESVPNLTLRPSAFKAIKDIRTLTDHQCGYRTVSCADVTALAARDAVYLSGGPHYPVPLGRRDGFRSATNETTIASLPSPSSDASILLCNLSKHHLDATDLVALSGGHTIGIGHCNIFDDRLYPGQDPTMGKIFAKSLRRTCPAKNTDNATVLDMRSPYTFDNKYYVNIMNRQGLFTSDQSLYTDSRTRPIVTSFAVNQSLFFEKFAAAMIKLGQLDVLTGNQGEIRAQC
ncbi:cationic peroxidase SPC4-like [Elaeis guineensis]|uniref:cationic peroxidase SPC4-like n=1 Tax=Elaeis guineensis var. tenera TaxID=51953 RepID=UPI003C6CE80F